MELSNTIKLSNHDNYDGETEYISELKFMITVRIRETDEHRKMRPFEIAIRRRIYEKEENERKELEAKQREDRRKQREVERIECETLEYKRYEESEDKLAYLQNRVIELHNRAEKREAERLIARQEYDDRMEAYHARMKVYNDR
jgi:hypothetical protein